MSDYNPADYNKGGFNALVFSMVTTMLFFIYVSFIHSGVDMKEIPAEADKAEAKVEAPAAAAPAAEPAPTAEQPAQEPAK